MAGKLKIIALGGLNEIGKNMTLYEYGKDILVVDCGLGFPDDEMYGVDIVIPDFSYLEKNKDRVRGIVLTHGHEDHIGAISYLLEEVNAPIYATAMTNGLVKLKLEEHKLLDKVKLVNKKPGDRFKVGCMEVEFIHVNHSIAGAVAVAVKTPVGMIIQTGDYKIDSTPIQESMIDLTRFGELGNEGVLALLADSTNVERDGFSPSERFVGAKLNSLFENCKNRIIITTFASNVHRIQQIIDVSAKHGRKVAITGRSMENVIAVSRELGYLKVPNDTLVDISKIKNYPKSKVTIITTGSQGESMSALYRMVFSGHKQIEIEAGDRVIISASAVPGNEKTISKVINSLFYKNADVRYGYIEDIHVSGHACRGEMKLLLALVRPKYFIPVHGEQRHMKLHAELAKSVGIEPKNILISETGRVIELGKKGAKLNGSVQSGQIMVDGAGIGDVGSIVLRDRKTLARDGMLVVVVNLSSEDNSIVAGPDIITRGFVYVKESGDLMEEMRGIVVQTIEACRDDGIGDWTTIKAAMKSALSSYLYKTTKRTPMILPVIMEL